MTIKITTFDTKNKVPFIVNHIVSIHPNLESVGERVSETIKALITSGLKSIAIESRRPDGLISHINIKVEAE